MDARKHMQWLFDPKGDLPKLALGGACLFALGSLIPLMWLIGQGGSGQVFHTTVGGEEYAIPLLTYSGWSGLLLLWGELLLVAGGFIFTAAPRFVPQKWQRVGHGILVGWSLLWALGTWRLGAVNPGFWTLQAMFLTALSACTIWRAWRGWTLVTLVDHAAGDNNYFGDRAAMNTPLHAGSTRQQIIEALQRARAAAVAASRKSVVAIKAGLNAARDTAKNRDASSTG